MIFNAVKVIHPLPQLSVVNADSSTIPITYPQIKQSLGQDVYNVHSFYIYSPNINQLQGQIQYNRFDASGRQTIKSIITTVDPYTIGASILQKVDQLGTMFILNGNSNFSTTILPNTNAQVKLYTNRLANSLIRTFNNFEVMERIFRLGGFEKPKAELPEPSQSETVEVQKDLKIIEKKENKFDGVIFKSVVAVSSGILAFFILKKVLDDRKY